MNSLPHRPISEKLDEAVRFARAVIDGSMQAQAALDKWPITEKDLSELRLQTLEVLEHQLMHYAADSDIRERDASYAQYQRELLKQCIEDLLLALKTRGETVSRADAGEKPAQS